MKLFSSIRTRLTLWYTAVVAVTIMAATGIAYLYTRETLEDNLDISLQREVEWLSEFIEPKARGIRLRGAAVKELEKLRRETAEDSRLDSSDEEQTKVDEIWREIYQHTLLTHRRQIIRILDRNNDLLYTSGHEASQLRYDSIPFRSIDVVTIHNDEGEAIRMAVSQNDYVKIFVAYPLGDLNEVLGNLFSSFLFIVPLALAISLIGGWFLAHTSLRPVDTIARTAREITAQNLNRRLPTLGVDDEIGRLTLTINNMIGRLEASFSQMQKFSADASHELRTPLTIIRGEVEVALRGKKVSPSVRRLLESIRDEVVRLTSIVEELISLVRSDAGATTFDFTPVPLATLLKNSMQDVQVLARQKEIHVLARRIETVTILGDRKRLRQLFLNILDNAVKYTPRHGEITISLGQQNGDAVVKVSDTGIGIPNKELLKIFDRFYRVSSNGNAIPGSGLGLSIARWIAEAHRGTITAKSQARKGSTFIVTLPLASKSDRLVASNTSSIP